MIIYEKENKLNINFDNSTEAEPDVVISKEDGQVNIEAGGQPIGGGGGALVVTFTYSSGYFISDKTMKEILDASKTGPVIALAGFESICNGPICVSVDSDPPKYITLIDQTQALFNAYSIYHSYTDEGNEWTIPD